MSSKLCRGCAVFRFSEQKNRTRLLVRRPAADNSRPQRRLQEHRRSRRAYGRGAPRSVQLGALTRMLAWKIQSLQLELCPSCRGARFELRAIRFPWGRYGSRTLHSLVSAKRYQVLRPLRAATLPYLRETSRATQARSVLCACGLFLLRAARCRIRVPTRLGKEMPPSG